ncbi:MAG: hypothetical protein Kow006_18240 [Gammaproteobacteria bacterium]
MTKPGIARSLLFLGLVVSLLGVAPPSSGSDGQDEVGKIVARVVQAYGGREALERVRAVKQSGTIQSHRLGKRGSLERLIVLPDRLRVDIDYPGGPREQRITTPGGAWRDGRAATGPMHLAMVLQMARFRLPLLLSRQGVRLLGEAEGLLRLGMNLSESTALEVFVDPASWRIVRSIGHMSFRGMPLSFRADYSDFRPVGDLLFAHREELMAMGTPTGIAVLERIEVNPDTTPADFRPLR